MNTRHLAEPSDSRFKKCPAREAPNLAFLISSAYCHFHSGPCHGDSGGHEMVKAGLPVLAAA